jgi:hypothetical protein
LVRQGRITLRGGKIDSEQADAELAAGLDPAFSHLSSGRIAMGPDIGSAEFRKARAVREGYAARLARLEFERRSGQLVNVKDVKVAIFAVAREVRDKLLNISSRVGALVAAESDEFKCEQIIDREVREALRSLKDEELEERVATFNQRAKETALGSDSARPESEED